MHRCHGRSISAVTLVCRLMGRGKVALPNTHRGLGSGKRTAVHGFRVIGHLGSVERRLLSVGGRLSRQWSPSNSLTCSFSLWSFWFSAHIASLVF